MLQKRLLLFIAIFLSSVLVLKGQSVQFGLLAGANLTQYSNQDLYHYSGRVVGLSGGPFVKIKIHNRWSLVTEMLYSRVGKFVQVDDIESTVANDVIYRYIELPLRVSYQLDARENYFRNSISLGVGFNQLINFKVTDTLDNDISEQADWKKKRALTGNLTLTQYFSPKIGMDLRCSISPLKPKWSWTYSARLFYVLFRDKN